MADFLPFCPLTAAAGGATGRRGCHHLAPALAPCQQPSRPRLGSSAASFGAREANGILGTQLGPSRNAKPVATSSSPSS
ncbi:hypothetical protein HHL22_06880 [Hymenobacter sp. RP-2-7]|uniref:Uncharacterized protein n=1 Tax=Hymenobacter polaris TaxID=2682546 RepID=A0A7Y0ACP4_9BACT|nr:hypothetical protein [Hymenobacter polaris]NML64927.1 hypothetical protein [Hymenobacter polaris]